MFPASIETSARLDWHSACWEEVNLELSQGCGPQRTALRGKFEAAYKKSVRQTEKMVVHSCGTTASLSRSTSITCTPSPGPSPGRLNVSVTQCSEDESNASPVAVQPKSPKSNKN